MKGEKERVVPARIPEKFHPHLKGVETVALVEKSRHHCVVDKR